jgi:hypothetical protein
MQYEGIGGAVATLGLDLDQQRRRCSVGTPSADPRHISYSGPSESADSEGRSVGGSGHIGNTDWSSAAHRKGGHAMGVYLNDPP